MCEIEKRCLSLCIWLKNSPLFSSPSASALKTTEHWTPTADKFQLFLIPDWNCKQRLFLYINTFDNKKKKRKTCLREMKEKRRNSKSNDSGTILRLVSTFVFLLLFSGPWSRMTIWRIKWSPEKTTRTTARLWAIKRLSIELTEKSEQVREKNCPHFSFSWCWFYTRKKTKK